MTTNELKSGTVVKLANGWLAKLMDNKKGNIRLAEVDGFVREMGSVYSHDIVAHLDPESGGFAPVDHTPAQVRLRRMVESF